jgi:NMD protein affecting ribosome stability and mRNA decay
MPTKCIACGSNEVFFENLCERCYLESHPILKQKKELNIIVCNSCELLSINRQWTNFYLSDFGTEALNSVLCTFLTQQWDFYYRPKESEIQHLELNQDINSSMSSINGVIDLKASPDVFVPLLTISETFKINLDWDNCIECRKRLSGSYKSKIQIRTQKAIQNIELEQWASEIENLSQSYLMTDGKNPLFRIEYLKSGIDALFQSKSVANSVGRIFAKKHGGIVSVTTEFAGFDKSKWKEYPRIPVVLITLPNFNLGDFVLYNNYPVQIQSFMDSKVEYWDFNKKEWYKIPIKSFMDSKPKILEKKVKKFQIISFEENAKIAQIMDNDTFEIHYIDSSDINNLSEGEFFSGIFHNGILIMKKNKNE